MKIELQITFPADTFSSFRITLKRLWALRVTTTRGTSIQNSGISPMISLTFVTLSSTKANFALTLTIKYITLFRGRAYWITFTMETAFSTCNLPMIFYTSIIIFKKEGLKKLEVCNRNQEGPTRSINCRTLKMYVWT